MIYNQIVWMSKHGCLSICMYHGCICHWFTQTTWEAHVWFTCVHVFVIWFAALVTYLCLFVILMSISPFSCSILLFVLQFFIILSCTIAVGTNLSQFICIGRFTAVSFQVLGHMKTILVLILGFFFFGKEGLTIQVVLGMVLAVMGMIWYGNASSKPGGKERRSYSISSDKSQRHGDLESGERDENA